MTIKVDELNEIRERVALAPDEQLFVKSNYNLYFMVRGVHTGLAFADVPIISESSVYVQKEYADFIAAAPDTIRRLLDALDTARRERDKLLIIVKPLRELWKRYITDDSLEDYATQDMFLDWLEKDTNLDDVFRALKTAVEIKESTDDHE